MPPAPDLDLLDSLSRDELIARARELGAKRPEVMTRVELRDEIVRLSEPDVMAQRRQRGWLGVARDLVASVVESGLNMRDAAAKIRGDQRDEIVGPPPVATVTLAEIYIAQGHPDRALTIVEEVLDREPDHAAALALRERLRSKSYVTERRRARVVEAEPDTKPPAMEPAEAAPLPVVAPSSGPELEPALQVASPLAPQDHAPPPIAAEPEPSAAIREPEPSAAIREPEPEPATVLPPACVLLRQNGGWIARWQGAAETGTVLRVMAFVPGKPRPQQITRDVPLTGAEGTVTVPEIPAQAVVRGALGRVSAGLFTPQAVASVVAEEGGRRAVYRPPGQGPSSLEGGAIS